MVERGDTLHDIAAVFGVSVGAIVDANQLGDRNRIFVGERLVIPAG